MFVNKERQLLDELFLFLFWNSDERRGCYITQKRRSVSLKKEERQEVSVLHNGPAQSLSLSTRYKKVSSKRYTSLNRNPQNSWEDLWYCGGGGLRSKVLKRGQVFLDRMTWFDWELSKTGLDIFGWHQTHNFRIFFGILIFPWVYVILSENELCKKTQNFTRPGKNTGNVILWWVCHPRELLNFLNGNSRKREDFFAAAETSNILFVSEFFSLLLSLFKIEPGTWPWKRIGFVSFNDIKSAFSLLLKIVLLLMTV